MNDETAVLVYNPSLLPATSTNVSTPVREKRRKREWKCDECDRVFLKNEHLTRHVRSHTKEKPFRCVICQKAYRRQDSLLRHARSHNKSLRRPSDTASNAMPSIIMDANIDPSLQSEQPQTANPKLDLSPRDDCSLTDEARSHRSETNSYHPFDPRMARPHPHQGDIAQRHRTENPLPSIRTPPQPNSATHTNFFDGVIPTEVPDLAFAVYGVGSMPYETSWLLGDGFDVDGLNSSLVTTIFDPNHEASPLVQPRGERVDGTNVAINIIDAPSHRSGRSCAVTHEAVRARWHTRAQSEPPSYDNLWGSMDQDRVDDAYREGLTSRLRQLPSDSLLPSADFLNLCIKLYFAKFGPIFPLIHAPTFRPSSENALLLLSICSIGALFVGSSSAAAQGRKIFQRLNKAILASWDKYIYIAGRESLCIAQAAILGQTFGMLSGNPNDLLMTESFHGTIISWARQAGIFRTKYAPVTIPEGENIDSAWRAWVSAEESIRVNLALHIHDYKFCTVLHGAPSLNHGPERIARCSSDELFAAPSSNQWRLLAEKYDTGLVDVGSPMGSTPPTTTAIPTSHSPSTARILAAFDQPPSYVPQRPALFQAYALVTGIAASICRVRDQIGPNAAALSDMEMNHFRSALLSWRDTWAPDVLAPYQIHDQHSLIPLWHEAFMALYADFDQIEQAIGREGPVEAEQAVEHVRPWVASPEGHQCLLHALFTIRRLEGVSVCEEPAIHVPKALFFAGLIVYCHLKFGDGAAARVNQSALLLPEFQVAAGTSGRVQLPHSVDSTVMSNVVSMLRHIGHWEISRRYASILEVLVNDLADNTPDGY